MKQNVLLITPDFAPSTRAGAHFSTKLAKYLTREGFAVTVLTGAVGEGNDPLLRMDLPFCGRVLRASAERFSPFSRFGIRNTKKTPPLPWDELYPNEDLSRFRNFLRGRVLTHRVKKAESSFYRSQMAYINSAGLDLSHFDVMLSVGAGMSSHMVALSLKAKCPTLRWIADFRRSLPNAYPAGLCRYFSKWKKRVLAKCERVTASSGAILKELRVKKIGVSAAVIPCGFDPEDFSRLPVPVVEERRPFTIALTPPFDLERGNVTVLFEAVSDLIKTGRVRRDQIVFDFYGSRRVFSMLHAYVEEMDLPPMLFDRGRASRTEVLSARRRAQLLVCSTEDSRARRGEVPAYFFELLSLEKPILGLSFGDVAGGEFSRLMHALRVGFCFEEELGRDSFEGLKKYIAETYTYWRTRCRDLYEPDEKRYRALSYENLIRLWTENISDV